MSLDLDDLTFPRCIHMQSKFPLHFNTNYIIHTTYWNTQSHMYINTLFHSCGKTKHRVIMTVYTTMRPTIVQCIVNT